MVIVELSLVVPPSSSVTVTVTVYVPSWAYVWLGLEPEPAGLPSPKFQLYDNVSAPGSVADDDKGTGFPSVPVGRLIELIVGATLATVTDAVSVAWSPKSSVTRIRTVQLPLSE